jgi:hypothetical protein
MLPSIRLIAATFFCGFLLVFAGLRIAASLNDIHTNLPIMAAQAATIEAIPTADSVIRRGSFATPVVYDLRFAPSGAVLTPILADLRPAAPPLDITPPPTGKVSKEELPAPVGSVEAKPKDEAPVAVVPDKAATDEPAVKPETPASPANDEPAAPQQNHSRIEWAPSQAQAETAGASPTAEAVQAPTPTPAETTATTTNPQIAALKEQAPRSAETVGTAATSADKDRFASTGTPAAEPMAPASAIVTPPKPASEKARIRHRAGAAPARKKPIRVAHRARTTVAAQPAANSFDSFGSASAEPFNATP